ncbi:MAG: VanW family protein [Firmicutes bacterium]|nr:VanW family protein [Bacillota bacterium]
MRATAGLLAAAVLGMGAAPAPVVVPPPGQAQAQMLKLPYLMASRTTTYYHAIPSQARNIELLAQRLNGTVVEPGQVFNYYAVVGPYTAANGYGEGRMFVGCNIVPSIGGGVCQGASTLYSAILRTGLPVVERHHHSLTVPYLPPGEDATVAGDYLNFRFRNNLRGPVLIGASAGNRHLTVAIWGPVQPPPIEVRHKVLKTFPYTTTRRVNPALKPGEERVIFPGQEGVTVESWLEIREPQGVVRRPLGIDHYRPSPRVVEVGPSA